MIKKIFTLLCLCLLCIGSAWGEEVTLASWNFTSGTAGTNYPSNKTNFSATGGSCTGSTFYLEGSGSTWNSTKGYAFTAVTSITITIKASEAIAKGTKITFKVTTFYNKSDNAPMKGFDLTCKEGTGSYVTTGLSVTNWSLSNSSAEKTVSYTTQNDIAKDGTIALKLAQTGKAGSGQGYMGPIVVTSEAAATEPCTVTFNAGTNGTCTTTSLTETSANAGVTLPACTANDGYVFKGWAEEGGSVVGQAGDTYKPSSDCTLYAVYNKTYVLTITQPADGGTLTVKNGDTQLETGANVEVGTNLTCEVTNIPEGKRFSRFYAKWGEGEKENKYKQTNPVTFENLTKDVLPANISALEVYVTYQDLAICTIDYKVNGVSTGTQENVYEGTALVFPAVGDLGGKVFVGWSETEISTPIDEIPTLVETASLTASEDKTYYAVFATVAVGELESKSSTLTIKTSTAPGTPWTDSSTGVKWSYQNVTFKDDNVAGMPNGSYVSIALPANATATKLTITRTGNQWSTSNISIALSGTSKTFNDAGYYTFTDADNKLGTYTLTATNKSSKVAYIDNIKIEFSAQSVTYSGYCTTVTPLAQNVTISSVGWATACLPFNATVSDNATAYYVTTSGSTLNKVEANVIPAGEGVLLKSNEGGAATVTFTETAVAADNIEAKGGNFMKGSDEVKVFDESGFKYYILANDETRGLGFYWQKGTAGTSVTCAAGKAVLAVPAGSEAKEGFPFDEEPTGISESMVNGQSTVVYNLNGMKVDKNYNGIVIMNGKKYMNK